MKKIKKKKYKIDANFWYTYFTVIESRVYKHGLTLTELKRVTTPELLEDFKNWAVGSTGPVLGAEYGYYEHDVRRFLESRLLNKPTYWD
jgi:hypothetical protein